MQVRSTREIAAHLQEMFGAKMSPSLIPAITDTVADEVRGWQSRSIGPALPDPLSGLPDGHDAEGGPFG